MTAAIDERVACAVPLIGVQAFDWALGAGQWQGRAASLREFFEAVALEAGRPLDAALVREVWERIAPGLLGPLDAVNALPLIAPRPLLVLNGERDARCPLEGVRLAAAAATCAYAAPADAKFRSVHPLPLYTPPHSIPIPSLDDQHSESYLLS